MEGEKVDSEMSSVSGRLNGLWFSVFPRQNNIMAAPNLRTVYRKPIGRRLELNATHFKLESYTTPT